LVYVLLITQRCLTKPAEIGKSGELFIAGNVMVNTKLDVVKGEVYKLRKGIKYIGKQRFTVRDY